MSFGSDRQMYSVDLSCAKCGTHISRALLVKCMTWISLALNAAPPSSSCLSSRLATSQFTAGIACKLAAMVKL